MGWFDEQIRQRKQTDRDVFEDAMKTFIKDFVKVMSKGDYDDMAEMFGISAAEAEANVKAAGFDTLNEFWEYVGKTAIKSFSAETIAEQIEEDKDDYSISGNRLRFVGKDGNVTELKVSCQKNKIVVKKVTFKSDSVDEESAEGIAALMFEGMTFVKVSD